MYEEKNTDLNSRFFFFSIFFSFFNNIPAFQNEKRLIAVPFFGIVMQISIRGVRYPSKEIMIIIIGETQWACIHLIWFRLRCNGYKVVSSATGPQLDIREQPQNRKRKVSYFRGTPHVFVSYTWSIFWHV